jgi:hypothetical protein
MYAAEKLAESALHRMSQPLTAMRCLLEFALEQDEPEVLRDFSERSMQECVRMAGMVHAFRDLLLMGIRSHDVESVELEELLELTEIPPGKKAVQREPASAGDVVRVKINRTALMRAVWHLKDLFTIGGGSADKNAENIERDFVVDAESVTLRWRQRDASTAAAWAGEMDTINPFAVTEYDFVANGIPRLTMIKTIAEAMGGDLTCDETLLELRLERTAEMPTGGAAMQDVDALGHRWTHNLRGA